VSCRTASVAAYAKVNLSLKVLHKRPDGYHEIRSVFQTIGLHDDLRFEFAPGARAKVELEDELGIKDNLVTRAAERFCEAYKVLGALRIRLKKRIPMGGGLGGGSADAASALLALPALTGRKVELEELMGLAAGLGSDVPFFLYGGTVLGLGRGEELYPLPETPRMPLLVLAPRVHVSTPEAYKALRRPELTSPVGLPKLNVFQSFIWRAYRASDAENDFEDAVFQLHPELGGWQRKLERSGARIARLSGSGAALFGVFPNQAKLQGALPQFRAESLQVFSTATLTRAVYRARLVRSLREHAIENTWPPQSRYAR
jgi:4-diphosphocytidyl-2-C-methyl-D-erythritol kinase